MELLKEIQEFHKVQPVPTQELQVACCVCKMWIGNALTSELDVPIKGSMFYHRPGTESLELPGDDAMGMDLLCPFSKTDDPADLHLFVAHLPFREIDADTLDLYRSNVKYLIEPRGAQIEENEAQDGICPCGCGGEVKEGKIYAARGCNQRHRWRRK
jgi:hypothetical protein